MNYKTLQKGDLKIVLDKDFLTYQKDEMLNLIDTEEFGLLTNKKNNSITKDEYKVAVNRLYNLALDIIDEKLGIDIFEYLPYTKKGVFHKTNSTLLATSGIKNVFNGDYFSMEIMDLRLSSVSYSEKINPFVAIKQTGDIFGQIVGDGTVAYIELDWHSRQKNEEPIFDAMNKPTKIEKIRNKYLKVETMKPGYTYFDAKGNEFLYAGQFYLESKLWEYNLDCTVYTNKETYLKSEAHKHQLKLRKNLDKLKYPGTFLFLKMTKKNEKIVQDAKDFDSLFKFFIHTEFWDWDKKWKLLENPLKIVSEGEKVIDDTIEEGFYYEEKVFHDNEKVSKDFFYFERIN